MNTYLKYQSPGIQFLSFMGLSIGFYVVTVVVSLMFFADLTAILLDTKATISPQVITQFKWAQVISSTLSFIVPALLFGYFSSPAPLRYLGVQKHFSIILAALCIVLLFTIQPLVGWLGELNAKANFGSLQTEMKQTEALHNRAMQSFLQMKDTGDLVINLVVMALLPAFGEELFFRGSLQKVLLRLNGKPWLTIFLSSAVFALMHSTFFKMLPIFVLGLMLGTIYYVTRNIWYCFVIHLLNNALAVLAIYYSKNSEVLKKIGNDEYSFPFYSALISLFLTVALILFIKKRSENTFAAAPVDDYEDDIAR